METQYTPDRNFEYHWKYVGTGGKYFEIAIINWILNVITLGLYYPWAKARKLAHLYQNTQFENSSFAFTGTGKEMFKGFIKAIVLMIVVYAMFIAGLSLKIFWLAILAYLVLVFLFIPLAIHGSLRYRLSRTEWRGIRMGFEGDRKWLMINFAKWLLFTLFTLGIYGAWMTINLRNYLISNIKFGNLKFRYQGDGGDFFLLNLKGYFLTMITLGIYGFWWQKELFDYYFDNAMIINEEDNTTLSFHATTKGMDFVGLLLGNFFITIFTLGLGTPFVTVRNLKFVAEKVGLVGNINFENIQQTEEDYKDATGEDMLDMLDLGFTF